MKVTELLEARAADDMSVNPSARVGRVIKSILGGEKPTFGTLIQGVSQPKKAGDAIVNIEVEETRVYGAPQKYDLSKLVGDDDDGMSKEIRDKLAARKAKALERASEEEKKRVAEAGKRVEERKKFMLTLFKRVKTELSGLKEVGYKQDDEGRNKYTYVPADEFDPEKMIKNWDRPIRFKFAFSSEVHSLKFDMHNEVIRVQKELKELIAKDPEFKDVDVFSSYEVMELSPTKEWVTKAVSARYGKDINNHPAQKEATTIYMKNNWTSHKKKLKELYAQTKSPMRMQLSGFDAQWPIMRISFLKPRLSDLKGL